MKNKLELIKIMAEEIMTKKDYFSIAETCSQQNGLWDVKSFDRWLKGTIPLKRGSFIELFVYNNLNKKEWGFFRDRCLQILICEVNKIRKKELENANRK